MPQEKFSIEQRLIGMGLHAVKPTVKYIGVFLDDESRVMLNELVVPIHARTFADHVTVFYAPGELDVERMRPLLGVRVRVEPVSVIKTDRCQLLGVNVIEDFDDTGQVQHSVRFTGNRQLHITISCDEHTEPSFSNHLLHHKRLATAITHIPALRGRIGLYMSDDTIDFGDEPKTLRFTTEELGKFLDMVDTGLAEEPELYRLWSIEHRAWWNRAHKGYVTDATAAGLYTRAEAVAICREANTHSCDEVMVPAFCTIHPTLPER